MEHVVNLHAHEEDEELKWQIGYEQHVRRVTIGAAIGFLLCIDLLFMYGVGRLFIQAAVLAFGETVFATLLIRRRIKYLTDELPHTPLAEEYLVELPPPPWWQWRRQNHLPILSTGLGEIR